MIYMQYATTLGQWTWDITQPAAWMKMAGAFIMIPGETSFIFECSVLTTVHQRQSEPETFSSIHPSTVWLHSRRTSSRPIKPMCYSTSAATAPPQSGNRPETGWAMQPIRATLPPVSIETNRSSSIVLWHLQTSRTGWAYPQMNWGGGERPCSVEWGLKTWVSP